MNDHAFHSYVINVKHNHISKSLMFKFIYIQVLIVTVNKSNKAVPTNSTCFMDKKNLAICIFKNTFIVNVFFSFLLAH